jgi:SAM-dependent methyltransferase
MNIQSIYRVVLPMFRRKRMRRFMEAMKPTEATRVLDVGGYPGDWPEGLCPAQIAIVNLDCTEEMTRACRHTMMKGNGCSLQFADKSYDIAYSNSVIEHLFTFEQQKRFAAEVRRVGGRLWVQTPARWFPVEPHLITLFIHYLPKSWQRKLLRYFTVWGLLGKPDLRQIDGFLAEVRLLTYREMKLLFPDCEIRRERFLGLTKAYVAVRLEDASKH